MSRKYEQKEAIYTRYSIHSGDGGMVGHGRRDLEEQADILLFLEGNDNEGFYIQDNMDDSHAFIIQEGELKDVSVVSEAFISHKAKYKEKVIR